VHLKSGVAEQERGDPGKILVGQEDHGFTPIRRPRRLSRPRQIEHANTREILLASCLAQLADALQDVPDSAEGLADALQPLAPLLDISLQIGQ